MSFICPAVLEKLMGNMLTGVQLLMERMMEPMMLIRMHLNALED